jgi:predicted O-linked N-acetylglucosamine transferase (SPINDLY family)/glycosyltransferase involved in cell wall biosynthesis
MNYSTEQKLPLVSICIPLFNKLDYIGRSIEMALNQTYSNLEIVINDNASTDGSDKIVKHYQSIDSRIKYNRLEHTIPINYNWQYTLLSAKGDYLHLLCGDDCISHNFIEEMMQPLLDNHKIDFTRCEIQPLFESDMNSEFIREINNGFNTANNFNKELLGLSNENDKIIKIAQYASWANYFGSMVGILFKRSCLPIEYWNTPFGSIACRSHPDWDLLIRFHMYHNGYYVDRDLAKFSYNATGDAVTQQGKKLSNRIRAAADDFLMPFTVLSDPGLSYIRQNMSREVMSKVKEITQYHLQRVFDISDKIDLDLKASIDDINSDKDKAFNRDNNKCSDNLISIIIPCYNHAHYLSEAVESVIDQTYTNWECIIINDGSPDNTSEIANLLIDKYSDYRIALVGQKNGGLSSARNAGIEASSGQYILCLDADDKIGSDFLQDSVMILQENPEVGFVYTDVQYFGSRTDIISYGDFNPAGFLRNNQATATSMFRREIFDSVGGYKEVMNGGLEDWEFWISAYESGWNGYRLAKPCFYYRQYDKGSMLQNLVGNKSKIQTLFATIISLHFSLYTSEEIAWAHNLLNSSDITFNTGIFQNSLFQECQQFLFSPPNYFEQKGAATEYYGQFQKWMSYAHQSIFTDTEDPSCKNTVGKLAKNTNFISAYFNEKNLRDIYTKRSEIIELSLQNNGNKVDYQFSERPANRKKIRLGILASHFNPSAETFAALPVYEYLSREFEVILYSFQQTNHPLEQYCRSSANFFVTLPDGLAEQVSAIRGDDLDILFFATNVTAVTNQMCLLASHRLARIQITSGGSVVTTGLKNMDYFISGTFTDPSPAAQEQYREELIQLPGAAHCFSYGSFEESSSITIDRQDLSIADDAVIFTSGANFYKIIPELIHTWAKIIAAVPNSTILLFPFGPNWSSNYPKQAFEEHLHKIFAEYGVSSDRVLALDPQPAPNREDLKEYYKLADVYLDSYPFAGTTSLIEPLQVNLPVIARQGNSFRSSMGAAMIRSLEITELVADSEESYIQLAVALGNNPELRQQKSDEVKAKMADNPSFLDSKGYGAKIGDLFKELVDRYSRNALSDNLRLKDVNLMVFPDWNQSEESVGLELQQVIQTLATQPDAQRTTLLIDTTNIAIEDAEMFLSSVAMNLMMEEDLDIMEELEISLIEDLNNIQWDNLLPRISARIVLECDNQDVVGKLPQEKIPQRQIESFVLS